MKRSIASRARERANGVARRDGGARDGAVGFFAMRVGARRRRVAATASARSRSRGRGNIDDGLFHRILAVHGGVYR